MAILGISCVSAAALMLEVALARLLSIAHGQELAYMVISLALLGYGIATPLLCKFPKLLTFPVSVWAWALALTAPVMLFISHRITLDANRLAWEMDPWLKTGLLYFLFSIPFLFSGLTIACLLTQKTKKVHFLYAGDLIGAGLGAMLPFFFSPLISYFTSSLLATMGGFFLAQEPLTKASKKITIVLVLGTLMLLLISPIWEPPMSPSRGLPTALLDPQARVLKTHWSAWTRVDHFSGAAARVAPGLSLNYRGVLPKGEGLAIDGDHVVPFLKDVPNLEWLDFIPHALAYSILKKPSVLLIHTQGGIEYAQALFHKSSHIDLLENDSLFQKLISQDSQKEAWHTLPLRTYLKKNPKKYDLIVMGSLGATGALTSGFGATTQNFDVTQQTLTYAFQTLSDSGFLSLHLYRLPPARFELRLLNTLIHVLKENKIKFPPAHLVILRTLQTYTYLISKKTFTSEQLGTLKQNALSLGYDFIHPSFEISNSLNNEITLLHSLVYEEPLTYPFSIQPITDNFPFPYQSLRITTLKKIIRSAKGHWQLILEGGGFTWTVFLQALLASFLILGISGRGFLQRKKSSFYFLAIGFGFMFFEIGVMQRFSVFLTHPAQAVPLVLGFILIGGGIGSYLNTRFSLPPTLACFLCVISSFFVLAFSFLEVFPYPQIFLGITFILFSIPLGIPFPSGLRHLKENTLQIPWVWGMNACASVCGAVLASALAPLFGFYFIFCFSAFCYLWASYLGIKLSQS